MSAVRQVAPVAQLEGVSVRLSGREIFAGVELTIEAGEFVAVLGPNGAGKSTLMRAMLGLVPPARGKMTVLGQRPARARPRVGYLPQRGTAHRAARVRGEDLVRLGLDGARWGLPLPGGARRRAERRRVAEVIELVGAEAYARRPLEELSGGEQQRLLIAQALASRPELLILDEPLDSLDLANQAAVAALLKRISTSEGVAILLVAHDINPLLAHIDRVVYLAGGRAVAGAVEEVVTTETLSDLYGAPIEVLETSDGRLAVVGLPEPAFVHGSRHRADP